MTSPNARLTVVIMGQMKESEKPARVFSPTQGELISFKVQSGEWSSSSMSWMSEVNI